MLNKLSRLSHSLSFSTIYPPPIFNSIEFLIHPAFKQIMSGKMSGKVLALLAENPTMTITELASYLDKSTRSIERALKALQNNDQIKRAGTRKSGYWVIL
jgi:predicted HTH transcriptional regulator